METTEKKEEPKKTIPEETKKITSPDNVQIEIKKENDNPDANKEAPAENGGFDAQMAELDQRAKEDPLEPPKQKIVPMKPSEIFDWSLKWFNMVGGLAYVSF